MRHRRRAQHTPNGCEDPLANTSLQFFARAQFSLISSVLHAPIPFSNRNLFPQGCQEAIYQEEPSEERERYGQTEPLRQDCQASCHSSPPQASQGEGCCQLNSSFYWFLIYQKISVSLIVRVITHGFSKQKIILKCTHISYQSQADTAGVGSVSLRVLGNSLSLLVG